MMLRRNIAALALFAAALIGFGALAGAISGVGSDLEAGLVRDAVKDAALTCYAVEGAYPPDLDHLCAYYGLRYDASRYVVFYDAFASNLMPEIRVIAKGSGE